MYILQNAFRNIKRNRGRNMLIGTIIFVIIIASVVALMINNTADGIIEDYKNRFAAEVSLVPNMEKMREQAMENSTDGMVRITRPTIPAEQYIQFGESEYLQDSHYTASVGINSTDMTAVDAELGGGSGRMMMGGPGPDSKAPTTYMMKLLGNQFEDFEEGTREIAEGRLPESENEGIVSTDLAELNEFTIGDTISFSSELSAMDEDNNTKAIGYTITIVGTYYDATDEYTAGIQQNAYTNRRNEVLTNYETVVAPFEPDYSGISINATYYLSNPDSLNAFSDELYELGLDPIFDVTTDEASYNKIVGPVEGLKSISITFMVIVLIFGGIIISLLSSIAIRERKYEIGVLRAMGMKKHTVAFGLWSEMLIITGLCLVVGIGVGTLVAQPVTDVLLTYQIEAAEAAVSHISTTGGMMMGMGNPLGNPNAQPLENINITLGHTTMIQMIGIALLLASIAGLVSISKITKYEPIKILMERN